MEVEGFFGIADFDVSGSEVEASAVWCEKVLGPRRLRRVDFPDRTMIVQRHDPSGLVIGLNQHQGSPGEPFDERRAGLDHVGFAVARHQELDVWQRRLVALDLPTRPLVRQASLDAPGSTVVFYDPALLAVRTGSTARRPPGRARSRGRSAGILTKEPPMRNDRCIARRNTPARLPHVDGVMASGTSR